jgi:hypothetical protein
VGQRGCVRSLCIAHVCVCGFARISGGMGECTEAKIAVGVGRSDSLAREEPKSRQASAEKLLYF